MYDDKGSNNKFLKYLLIGGGIGAVISLLYAPKKGTELRKDIKDEINSAIKKAGGKANEFSKYSEKLADDIILNAQNIYKLMVKYTSGKYNGTKEKFEIEYKSLKSALLTAIESYKKYNEEKMDTEKIVDEIFPKEENPEIYKYDDEVLPKFEGIGRRKYTKREMKLD